MNAKKTSLLLAAVIAAASSFAQEIDPKLTEVYTPVPKVVTPAKVTGNAPSDAIVLFDGKGLGEWVSTDDTTKPAAWTVGKKLFTVKKGTGNIQTRKSFTDYQLHIEWRIPADITGEGQARGNSGLFLASTGKGDDGYEMQILDCYNNSTYTNGQTASIYKQSVPLVNACKKPGEWQSYDVVWVAPRFNEDGSLKSPATVTAFHNGIVAQNNYVLKGETAYRGAPVYKKIGPSPIKLQAHGDKSEPISFRNIWIREL